MSVLSPAIQAELHFTDTQIGFLLGTAFAVLYGVLGIPMGRIADALSRTRLMAFGLALWSAMTALSGFAVGFASLGAARVGVGVGEATANPVAHSLLCDYFPARNRSAVLGSYLASVHLGIGTALVFGGLLMHNWNSWCTSFPGGACEISSWRAGFLIVGIPGVILAILVAFLREPPRPTAHVAPPARQIILQELSAAIPPFTLFTLARLGGRRAAVFNMMFMALLVVAAAVLAWLTGDWAQWIAVAIGIYSVATWAQVLKFTDPPLYALTFGCPTFMYTTLGGASLTCFVGTIQIWSAPYAMRTLDADTGRVGVALGLTQLAAAVTSVICGGIITDWWKRRDARAPIWIALIALTVPIPLLFVMLGTKSLGVFIAALAGVTLFFDVMGRVVRGAGSGSGPRPNARCGRCNLLACHHSRVVGARALSGGQDQHDDGVAHHRVVQLVDLCPAGGGAPNSGGSADAAGNQQWSAGQGALGRGDLLGTGHDRPARAGFNATLSHPGGTTPQPDRGQL